MNATKYIIERRTWAVLKILFKKSDKNSMTEIRNQRRLKKVQRISEQEHK